MTVALATGHVVCTCDRLEARAWHRRGESVCGMSRREGVGRLGGGRGKDRYLGTREDTTTVIMNVLQGFKGSRDIGQ